MKIKKHPYGITKKKRKFTKIYTGNKAYIKETYKPKSSRIQ